MIKILLIVITLSTTLTLFAQRQMQVWQDGVSTLLVTIEKITFEADVLVMTTTEGEFRLPLDDVEKITFGDNDASTAVENVNTNSIHISKSGNILTIKSDATITHVYLVDMSGKVLVSEKLASVDMTNLTLPNSGVFVLFVETSQGYIARKVINN
jgi:hypothetical protein